MTAPRAYFYGCQTGRIGHYMFEPGMAFIVRCSTPWRAAAIDGAMQPGCGPGVPCWRVEQRQGVAVLHHKDGWSMLSFWDRSVDDRYNSNGNFIIEGEHSFEAMCEFAEQLFPEVWSRLGGLAQFEPSPDLQPPTRR